MSCSPLAGPQAVSHSDVRAWRKVKPEILNMVETFFQHMSPDDMEVIVQVCDDVTDA